MSTSLDSRAITIGLAISVITAMLSISLVPIFFSDQDTRDQAIIDWDFDTSNDFALSMNQALPKLIYASVLTGIVSSEYIANVQNWNATSIPYFLSRISSFQYSPVVDSTLSGTKYNPDDLIFKNKTWDIKFLDCCPSEKKSMTLTNVSQIQNQLQSALSSDIKDFSDLVTLTLSLDETIKNVQMQKDVFYWEIIHVYDDGTEILIQAYGKEIIIRQIMVKEILLHTNGFIFMSEFENQSIDRYTSTNIDPFQNYIQAINQFFSTILN